MPTEIYLSKANAPEEYETIDKEDVKDTDKVIEEIHEEAKTEEKENDKGEKEIVEVSPAKDKCTVSEFTKQINELCEETNRKKLTAKFVNELLLDKGYLKETAEQGEEKHKRVTEKGRLAGILEEERHAKYGKSYYALIHTRESQSMNSAKRQTERN